MFSRPSQPDRYYRRGFTVNAVVRGIYRSSFSSSSSFVCNNSRISRSMASVHRLLNTVFPVNRCISLP